MLKIFCAWSMQSRSFCFASAVETLSRISAALFWMSTALTLISMISMKSVPPVSSAAAAVGAPGTIPASASTAAAHAILVA